MNTLLCDVKIVGIIYNNVIYFRNKCIVTKEFLTTRYNISIITPRSRVIYS